MKIRGRRAEIWILKLLPLNDIWAQIAANFEQEASDLPSQYSICIAN